jgi:long-subunit fatty acid transport protein
MKLKATIVTVCFFMSFASLFAGGIVTNTNQSASWARNPSTASTLGIEAVYYNPAATTKLGPGLFLSVSNLSVFQKREIENSYSGLRDSQGNFRLYKGTVDAPIFPSLYAAYNLDKFSFSFGFNPVGGGGSAEFKKGLPSFEIAPSDLVPSLAKRGVTAYQLDAYFKGTSIYFGYQFGVAYKVNDMVSLYAGLRYVTAKNTYEGHLQNVQVNMGGTWMNANTVLGGMASQVQGMLAVPSSLQPLIDGGGGGLTLAQAQGAGYISATSRAGIEQGLAAIGVPQANIPLMNITQVQGAYNQATPALTQQYYTASVKSKLLRNQKADVEQTGSGICPIVGVNLTLLENKLNIGLKYEFATQMELKNKTTMDFVMDSVPGPNGRITTMFPDGAKTPADMPALLTVGVSYKVLDKLGLSGSLWYYFDKAVEYGKKLPNDQGILEFVSNDKVIDDNFIEFAFGAEYNLTEKMLVSTGYMYGKTGVDQTFQSDMNFSVSSHTFGVGGKYSISPKMDVNLGLSWSMYEKGKKHAAFSKSFPNEISRETYLKSTFTLGIGVNIKLSK